MTTDQTRATVRALYDAIGNQRVSDFLALVDDQVSFRLPGGGPTSRWLPNHLAAVFFPAVSGLLGLTQVRPHHLFAHGDRAVALLDVSAELSSGERSTRRVAETWTVRPGKAVEVRPWGWDTRILVQLADWVRAADDASRRQVESDGLDYGMPKPGLVKVLNSGCSRGAFERAWLHAVDTDEIAVRAHRERTRPLTA
jgi:ketosteroid isomerase-like protein